MCLRKLEKYVEGPHSSLQITSNNQVINFLFSATDVIAKTSLRTYFLSLDSHHCLKRHEFDNTTLIHCLSRVNADMWLQVRIISSINGLICIRTWHRGLLPPILLLWNPSLKEIKEVPRANDDLMGHWCIGFGFSAITNDYKIVKIHTYRSYHDENGNVRTDYTKFVNGTQVYSLNTGLWKDVEFGAIEGVYVCPNETSVSINGAIIWVGENRRNMRGVIILFDIETEVFTLLPVPLSQCRPYSVPAVYDNKLALVQCYSKSELCNFIHLWVIENTCGSQSQIKYQSKKNNTCLSGGRWSLVKKYSGEPCPHPYKLVPISIWANEIVCRMKSMSGYDELDGHERTVCLLNPKTYEVKKFVMDNSWNHDIYVYNHVESLVPVRGRTLI